jgi:lipoate-protein ligase A
MFEVQKYNLPDLDIIDAASAVSVFVWQPDKTYLVLGQSNKAESSLETEAVLADGITVVKRPSGGETVLLTPNTIVIGIALSTETLKNPQVYFRKINESIIAVLAKKGVENLLQKGISDIAIGEKKILGSSIYRRPNRVFYHAVLNVAEDINIIAKYIRHPAKEPDYRKGRPHSEFVTSLWSEGFNIPIDSLLVEMEIELYRLLPESF